MTAAHLFALRDKTPAPHGPSCYCETCDNENLLEESSHWLTSMVMVAWHLDGTFS